MSIIPELKPYKFVPKITPFLKKIKIKGLSFEYIGEEEKLTQIISRNAVSLTHTQSIRFKIVRSATCSLYMGLALETRLELSHSALARDGSTISFRPNGKRRFHLLSESMLPDRLPLIKAGDTVEMVV